MEIHSLRHEADRQASHFIQSHWVRCIDLGPINIKVQSIIFSNSFKYELHPKIKRFMMSEEGVKIL